MCNSVMTTNGNPSRVSDAFDERVIRNSDANEVIRYEVRKKSRKKHRIKTQQ